MSLFNFFLARKKDQNITTILKQNQLHDTSDHGRDVVHLRLPCVQYFDRKGAAFDLHLGRSAEVIRELSEVKGGRHYHKLQVVSAFLTDYTL